jgi:CRP-like cAMP-binding protein
MTNTPELSTIAALAHNRAPRKLAAGEVITTAISDAELLEMNRQEFLFAMQELPVFGLEMQHDLEQRLEQLKLKAVAG